MSNGFIVRHELHKYLTDEELDKIISLKMQHWEYSKESQIKWIKENIDQNDIHLMVMVNKDNLIAYLNMVRVSISANGNEKPFFGIGNVCVDKQYLRLGYGGLIMNISRFVLQQSKLPGILLCKKYLIEFYSKGNWFLFNGGVFIQGKGFDGALLSTERIPSEKIDLPKIF